MLIPLFFWYKYIPHQHQIISIYTPISYTVNQTNFSSSCCILLIFLLQMSTIQSLILVLSLLFFPVHRCRARDFEVFNKEPVEGLHLSSKNNEVQSLVRVSIQPDNKASEATKTESKNHDDDKLSPAKPVEAPSRKSPPKVEVSGAVQSEPAVSVSWRLPHKKQGEEGPVYNLDYLPPQTHPSHNN